MSHHQQIYKGESIGLQLSPNVPLAGWEIEVMLSTTPNDYSIRACYPSPSSEMLPLVCENGILKLHVPSGETAKLSEGVLLLQIVLRQGKVVKMGTFLIAEVVSQRSIIADRGTTLDLPLTIVSNKMAFSIDMGPNAAMDGRSAYECYQRHYPESALTEQEWLASLRGPVGPSGPAPHPGANGNWWIEGADTGASWRGAAGKSAFQYAVEGGYEGTEASFARSLSEQMEYVGVAGVDVTLEVEANRVYTCGELRSLKLASIAAAPGLSIVRFRSGARATELTLPEALPVAGWRIPQAERDYAVFIQGGAATIVFYE